MILITLLPLFNFKTAVPEFAVLLNDTSVGTPFTRTMISPLSIICVVVNCIVQALTETVVVVPLVVVLVSVVDVPERDVVVGEVEFVLVVAVVSVVVVNSLASTQHAGAVQVYAYRMCVP